MINLFFRTIIVVSIFYLFPSSSNAQALPVQHVAPALSRAFIYPTAVAANDAFFSGAITTAGRSVLSVMGTPAIALGLLFFSKDLSTNDMMVPVEVPLDLRPASKPVPPDVPKVDNTVKVGPWYCFSHGAYQFCKPDRYIYGNNLQSDGQSICNENAPGSTFVKVVEGESYGGCDDGNGIGYYINTYEGENKSCPSGYTYSSGVCNLANAYAAKSDKKCAFGRDGTKIISLGDVDCKSANIVGALQSDGSYLVSGTDSEGSLFYYQVRPTADLGSSVRFAEQYSVDSLPYTQYLTIELAPDGVVRATYSTVQPGLMQAPSADSFPAGPSTGTDGSSGSIKFPTDYARQGEAKVASDSLADRLLQPSVAPSDPSISGLTYTDTGLKKALSDVIKFTFPNTAGVCPVLDLRWSIFGYDMGGRSEFVCEFFAQHGYLLTSACLCGFVVFSLIIVLRA